MRGIENRPEYVCPACGGTGKDKDGNKCGHCNGTGKAG